MPDQNTSNAVATRDFNDAGTEQSFTKGATFQLPQGVFENYAAAGLVERAPAGEAPLTVEPPVAPARRG